MKLTSIKIREIYIYLYQISGRKDGKIKDLILPNLYVK